MTKLGLFLSGDTNGQSVRFASRRSLRMYTRDRMRLTPVALVPSSLTAAEVARLVIPLVIVSSIERHLMWAPGREAYGGLSIGIEFQTQQYRIFAPRSSGSRP